MTNATNSRTFWGVKADSGMASTSASASKLLRGLWMLGLIGLFVMLAGFGMMQTAWGADPMLTSEEEAQTFVEMNGAIVVFDPSNPAHQALVRLTKAQLAYMKSRTGLGGNLGGYSVDKVVFTLAPDGAVLGMTHVYQNDSASPAPGKEYVHDKYTLTGGAWSAPTSSYASSTIEPTVAVAPALIPFGPQPASPVSWNVFKDVIINTAGGPKKFSELDTADQQKFVNALKAKGYTKPSKASAFLSGQEVSMTGAGFEFRTPVPFGPQPGSPASWNVFKDIVINTASGPKTFSDLDTADQQKFVNALKAKGYTKPSKASAFLSGQEVSMTGAGFEFKAPKALSASAEVRPASDSAKKGGFFSGIANKLSGALGSKRAPASAPAATSAGKVPGVQESPASAE